MFYGGDTMKIKLNEISKFSENYCNGDETLLMDITETDDYMDYTMEQICIESKHILNEMLLNAIRCNFDREILSIDYGYSNDFIELLREHANDEININFGGD